MKPLILALLLATTNVFACSCLPAPPISVALTNSDFVLHVRCLSFAIKSDSARSGDFKIIKIFKGKNLKDSCSIETGISSASCGFDFIAGNEYLVYGSISDGVLRTNICTRTKWLFLPRDIEKEYSALLQMGSSPIDKWKDFDLPESKDPFE